MYGVDPRPGKVEERLGAVARAIQRHSLATSRDTLHVASLSTRRDQRQPPISR